MQPSSGNMVAAVIFVVLALLFAGAAIFYFTTQTSLLASDYGTHYKHALLCTGLAIASLVGANIARPKSS